MKRSSAPPIAAAAGQPKMRSAAALNSTTFSFSSTVMMPSIADRRMPSGSSAASVKSVIRQPFAVLTPGTPGPGCRMSPQVTGKYTEMPAAPGFDADQLARRPPVHHGGGLQETTMPRALTIIRDEHRTIAAILHGMEYLVREIRARRKKIDPQVFHAMIYYLDTFAERVHHPKEDKYLFGVLRQRNAEAAGVIDQLEREHAGGAEALRRLAQAMIRYEEGGDKEFGTFEREVGKFVDAYRAHMRKEEEQLFPLALGVLTPLDWVMIDSAFAENRDPLADEREEKDLDRLFSRIVSIAPPPIGIGPAARQ